MILYLTIASLLTSFSTILHRVDYNNETTEFYRHFCIFGGFFEQMTSWMLLNSVSCITIYLFAMAVLNKDTEKLEVAYVLAIFLFPFLINWIPFIHSSYGRAGAWCWIRIEEMDDNCTRFTLGKYFIFILWFVPLYVILTVLVVMYVFIIISLKWGVCSKHKYWGQGKATTKGKDLLETNKHNTYSLLTYPLIFLVLEIFPLMNRIQNAAHHNQPSLVFWYMSALAFPLTGGLIGIAYALDARTRRRLTWPHVRLAFTDWTKKDKCSEYPIEYVEGDDQGEVKSYDFELAPVSTSDISSA